MAEYKIILADDHEILRKGLTSLLSKDKGFKIVGEARDGLELLDQLRKVKCDLVVVDLSMPNMDGIAAIKAIKKKFPRVKILVLTMQGDNEHFKHAMSAGADGYVLKDDAFDQLSLAIKMIMKRKKYISPAVSSLVADRYVRSLDDFKSPSLDVLTKRELQILALIAEGFSNKQIASKLHLSIRTVETHRLNLTDKLGIKSIASLVKFAANKGLV